MEANLDNYITTAIIKIGDKKPYAHHPRKLQEYKNTLKLRNSKIPPHHLRAHNPVPWNTNPKTLTTRIDWRKRAPRSHLEHLAMKNGYHPDVLKPSKKRFPNLIRKTPDELINSTGKSKPIANFDTNFGNKSTHRLTKREYAKYQKKLNLKKSIKIKRPQPKREIAIKQNNYQEIMNKNRPIAPKPTPQLPTIPKSTSPCSPSPHTFSR